MREQRIHACWRTRACAAGLCVGAQLFLAGCAVGMPLALSSTWLAALPVLALAAWLAARSRRAMRRHARPGMAQRAGYGLLFAAMIACALFALASVTSFAAQTLASQAQPLWIETAALFGAVLCALNGPSGAARLVFALRYALPAVVLGLSAVELPMRVPVGLFPILGAGAGPLGLAAVCMLFGAAPALMLILPPPELEDMQDWHVPDRRFFLGRVLLGALAGAALLFAASACTTYESIAQSGEWGARLRMAAGNQPHEGILQMALTLAKLMAMLLLAVNMLCASQQALALACPRLGNRYAGLAVCTAMLAAGLLAQTILGDAPLLLCAPLITAAAIPAALLLGRRDHG